MMQSRNCPNYSGPMAQRYRQIADLLADRIERGTLEAGTRLPTHRALADEHGVALATATKVYRALIAAGLVVGEPGRGTFVRDRTGFAGLEPRRVPRHGRVADLSFNQPHGGDQAASLRTALRDLAADGDVGALLRQQPPGGDRRCRAAMATHALDRGIDVAPDAVLVTSGAQHGLDATLGALAGPNAGDAVVAADALTYPGLRLSASARRVEVAALPVAADGTDLDALDRLCRSRRVTAVYAVPTLHNPLGWVLDDQARDRLTAIARRHDLVVVEDATYAFLHPDAPAPLQSRAPERTVYVASLSKSVGSGLRVGFLIAPPALRPALTRLLRATSWSAATLATTLAARWIRDGTVTRAETLRRDDARSRQRLARTALAGLDYRGHPDAPWGWLVLPDEARADIVAARLARRGVLVSTADAFALTPHAPNALRLALATPETTDLTEALALVRDVATGTAPPDQSG